MCLVIARFDPRISSFKMSLSTLLKVKGPSHTHPPPLDLRFFVINPNPRRFFEFIFFFDCFFVILVDDETVLNQMSCPNAACCSYIYIKVKKNKIKYNAEV